MKFGRGAMWVKIMSSKANLEGIGHMVPIDTTEDLDMYIVMIVGEYLSVRGRSRENPLFTNLNNL
jgi:hypothetical protein